MLRGTSANEFTWKCFAEGRKLENHSINLHATLTAGREAVIDKHNVGGMADALDIHPDAWFLSCTSLFLQNGYYFLKIQLNELL